MQVSCPQCATRLQLNTDKLPEQPFTIKCPKCQTSIMISPSALATEATTRPAGNLLDDDPLGLFDENTSSATTPLPASAPPTPATATEPPVNATPPVPSSTPAALPSDWVSSPSSVAVGWTNSMPAPTVADDSNTLITAQPSQQDLLQAIASLLMAGPFSKPHAPLEQNRRRNVVACLASPEDVSKVQAVLHDQPYDLTFATSPEQVTAMLQMSHQLDILLLDPNFHSQQQGGAMIMRYLNMLNPARRRRVFVVVISHSYRSLDMQVAFTHGVNLVINSGELETLPTALSKSIQEFNNLYRAFNEASGMSPF